MDESRLLPMIKNIFSYFKSTRSTLLFSLLMALAFLRESYDLSLSFGVSLSFSSIALLLIVWLFGVFWGTISAILVYAYYIVFLNLPYEVMLGSLEILFVGVFLLIKKRHILLGVVIYWLLIGGPITGLTLYYVTGNFGSETQIVILQQTLNVFLSALIAEIIITYVPLKRWMGLTKSRFKINFGSILFHLSITAVVGPLIAFMVIDGWGAKTTFDRDLTQIIELKAQQIEGEVLTWDQNELRALRLRSVIQLGILEEIIQKNSLEGSLNISVLDQGNHIFATNKSSIKANKIYDWREAGEVEVLKGYFYHRLPLYKDIKYETSRWSESDYIYERPLNNVPVKLVVEIPLFHQYQDIMQNYVNRFLIILLFSLVAIIFSFLIRRLLAHSLSQLAETTTGLPDKLKRLQVIDWPQSRIEEVGSLIYNFKLMSTNVTSMFLELNKTNKKLVQQTKKLKESEEQLHKQAFYDSLTGLPNRFHFNKHLKEVLDKAKLTDKLAAVMFMDMDKFKQINDTLGHDVGDTLLQEVSKKLSCISDEKTMIARLGGDEFVVILYDTDEYEIRRVAEKIIHIFSETIIIQDYKLELAVSIGVSVYPRDADGITTILKNADTAMYMAKETGGNRYRFFQ
jgi:diguanylate cyclase (GGDEF)-like protein